MKSKSRTMRIGLCALALGAGMAAQGAAPVITDTALVPRFTTVSYTHLTLPTNREV